MPLSELHRATTRGKVESAQSKMSHGTSDFSPLLPDQDFAELLWENGQIVMQGQSSKHKRSLHPSAFSPHSLAVQEKHGGGTSIQKFAQFETMDVTLNELSSAVPRSNIGLNAHGDDMAPWMTNYPIEDTLCSEFFTEFAGINPNSPSIEKANSSAAKDPHTLEHSHTAKTLEPSRFKTNQFFQLSQQLQSPVMNTKSSTTKFGFNGGGSQFQKKDLGSSSKTLHASNGSGVMNFSHFSRPFALAKSKLESVDRLRSHGKTSCTAATSNPTESTVIESSGIRGNSSIDLPKAGSRLATKVNGEFASVEPLNPVDEEDAYRNNHQKVTVFSNNNRSPDDKINHQSSSFATSVAIGGHEAEKGPEAVVASSVCSGICAGAASNDPKDKGKRKHLEGEESGYQSEDLDNESIGVKKPTAGKGGSGTKRSRAAEVHNLSERRRRDKINERMRALQELIPNCNKVDKASMLDEAIEYLKSLQLQVQMMAMGSGVCMTPVMLPPGMQHIRAPSMAHFSPVGAGMGMGFNYGMGMLDMNGSQGFPLIPVQMHTPQLYGIPNHGQALNMPMPRPSPFSPFSGHTTSNSVNEAAAAANPLSCSDVGPSSGHNH